MLIKKFKLYLQIFRSYKNLIQIGPRDFNHIENLSQHILFGRCIHMYMVCKRRLLPNDQLLTGAIILVGIFNSGCFSLTSNWQQSSILLPSNTTESTSTSTHRFSLQPPSRQCDITNSNIHEQCLNFSADTQQKRRRNDATSANYIPIHCFGEPSEQEKR